MPQAYVTNLDDNARKAMIDLLNARVAESIDLANATKQAHWNVKGTGFIGFHELLDDVAKHMRKHTDAMAERAVILGGYARGTVQVAAERTNLEPFPLELADIPETARQLSDRMIKFGGMIRDAIDAADEAGDDDTADLFTEISRIVDKDAWFVGAHGERT
jgi:starvation-inducible DNA-binding protein